MSVNYLANTSDDDSNGNGPNRKRLLHSTVSGDQAVMEEGTMVSADGAIQGNNCVLAVAIMICPVIECCLNNKLQILCGKFTGLEVDGHAGTTVQSVSTISSTGFEDAYVKDRQNQSIAEWENRQLNSVVANELFDKVKFISHESKLDLGGFLSTWIMNKLGIRQDDRVAYWKRNKNKVNKKLGAKRSTSAQRVGEVVTSKWCV